jgi:hypothetical protein
LNGEKIFAAGGGCAVFAVLAHFCGYIWRQFAFADDFIQRQAQLAGQVLQQDIRFFEAHIYALWSETYPTIAALG